MNETVKDFLRYLSLLLVWYGLVAAINATPNVEETLKQVGQRLTPIEVGFMAGLSFALFATLITLFFAITQVEWYKNLAFGLALIFCALTASIYPLAIYLLARIAWEVYRSFKARRLKTKPQVL